MRSAFLGSFNGLNGSGSWTLFAADLQLGETSRLNDWSIELKGVSAVPEPTTNALILFAALLGLAPCGSGDGVKPRAALEGFESSSWTAERRRCARDHELGLTARRSHHAGKA